MDSCIRFARQRYHGGAWNHCGTAVGQSRSARGVSEFHHSAAYVSVRGVLFTLFAAAVVAGFVTLEPVLLHGRRFSLRLLRYRRRVTLALRDGRRCMFAGAIFTYTLADQSRLQ